MNEIIGPSIATFVFTQPELKPSKTVMNFYADSLVLFQLDRQYGHFLMYPSGEKIEIVVGGGAEDEFHHDVEESQQNENIELSASFLSRMMHVVSDIFEQKPPAVRPEKAFITAYPMEDVQPDPSRNFLAVQVDTGRIETEDTLYIDFALNKRAGFRNKEQIIEMILDCLQRGANALSPAPQNG